jgi:hypothetical protein
MGVERHQREEAKHGWSRAGDRAVRPVALGLYTEMGAHLAERHLELPAQQEPGDDLERISGDIGAKDGLHGEFAPRVTDEDPRMGTGGKPVWYQTAVALKSWMGRSRSPYQRVTV